MSEVIVQSMLVLVCQNPDGIKKWIVNEMSPFIWDFCLLLVYLSPSSRFQLTPLTLDLPTFLVHQLVVDYLLGLLGLQNCTK